MSKYRGAGDELEPEREQERREWEESKHPRDSDGKFTSKGGGVNTASLKSKKTFINIQLHAKLPDYEKAKIPERKILEYSLKDENKSYAFQKALGYNQDNYLELIQNIYDSLPKFEAEETGDKGYGNTYAVIMRLKGANGKTATVTTSWIKDKKTGGMRLTNAYVSKEKKFKGDQT